MKHIILFLIFGYSIASSSLREEESPFEEVLEEKVDTEETSSAIDPELLKGAIFIPNDHVEDFEAAMTPRIEELVLDEDEEFDLPNEAMHRHLGTKSRVRWCRICPGGGVGTAPYAGHGGCYYRNNFRGNDAIYDHRAMKEVEDSADATVSGNGEVDVNSNENESRNLKKKGGHYDKLRGSYDSLDGSGSYDGSYDSGSYDSSSSYDSYDSPKKYRKRGRGPKWHCYDAWKYGTYVGYKYKGRYYAYERPRPLPRPISPSYSSGSYYSYSKKGKGKGKYKYSSSSSYSRSRRYGGYGGHGGYGGYGGYGGGRHGGYGRHGSYHRRKLNEE
uniref:Uncharacterized protein n=1 Tax=Leptocylindrus danicus TaxID=163516 RepID=A0A7S2JRH8_9STRA|mmetsp:Transcript_10707/g.16083  ORF Transcript_10707/g.16083 Transcript_10707/m.16083 type:complete len:330 (+) Transcript_10707:2932-3921(+)|eukprot:CAMPEP_0116023802 /NCGR_PEP_ID=MMETSP0321-20121206/11868_1 /TAXON_ID=163516 /ORGANISM="Leptocylindrus danicus var. danicus, Strain B650" /LENGTH=329 /DNA_ID=CAMNT_0003495271 /DNA_START=2836 /DNA_END=3825 /DNA_ORIENTATION=+